MGTDPQYGWPIKQNGQIAIGFTDNYFWRMDFDIGSDASNDVIEKITSTRSGSIRNKQVATVTTETADSFNPTIKKFWRVRDGLESNGTGYISYELVLLDYGRQSNGANSESWLNNDVYLTRYNACERFAVQNPSSGCTTNVNQFKNGQNINNKDVVVWYRQAYHHLPRDEDDNRIGMRWSSFLLLPRDWNYSNPL